jgi:steroid delta-isomerase-like uncharacterized protein
MASDDFLPSGKRLFQSLHAGSGASPEAHFNSGILIFFENAAATNHHQRSKDMSSMDSKEFGRHYIDVIWNQSQLDKIDELTAPDIVRHDPASGVHHGIEEFRAVVTALHAAFHPMHFTVNWQVGEGDSAAHHWTVTGTHIGEFMGIAPTGKQFTLDGITIYRFDDGKLAEERTVWDALGLLNQLK